MSTPSEKGYASVLLDDALDKPLDYAIPSSWQKDVAVGMRVLVPLQKRLCKGVILELKNTPEFPGTKEMIELLSETPLLSPDMLRLAEWVSRYYCTPLRKVLRVFLPPTVRGEGKPKTQLFVTSPLSRQELLAEREKLLAKHPEQAAVLQVLANFPKGILLSDLLTQAKTTQGPVQTLSRKKILLCEPEEIDRSPLAVQEYFLTQPKLLNEEQKKALTQIQTSIDAASFQVHLLHGITGSGKTEIYLQAIAHALEKQKGVILLIPEIALSSQMVESLMSRFARKVALLHHRLGEGARYDTWHQIHKGQIPIVVGTRSAIFSPVANLGLIIVDEEHESAYKQQDEAPCYHARDVAIMRAKLSHATALLGSATPSLESYHNASQGKYALRQLPLRADKAALPQISLVDMKEEFLRQKRFTLFSDRLIQAIRKRLEQGEQTLLFLNRRGFYTHQLCQRCSYSLQCPHCDMKLTFHLGENILACHLCDYRLFPPKTCPKCSHPDGLKYKGAGTENVEKALHALFPEARTLRIDGDTTKRKGSHEKLFKQFRSGKADVLIGTQMVAKGLHFPALTLVGVLNADTTLNIPDFRASEQVFQLITQVAGRAGRGDLPGEVIIQTSIPDHPILLQAAGQNFEVFYAQEIASRELFHYPPFTHLIKLTFTGPSLEKTTQLATSFRERLITHLPSSCQLYPVIPCGYAKIKDQYRLQLLLRTEKVLPLTPLLSQLQKSFSFPKGFYLSIDVDPLATYS